MQQKIKACRLGLALGTSLLLCGLPSFALTEWYLLKTGGETIGQVRIEQYLRKKGGHITHVTEVSHVNRIQREDSPFEIRLTGQFEENPTNGKPLKFHYQYQLNRENWADASGELQDNHLSLTMGQGEQAIKQQANISKHAFLFPDGPAMRQAYRKHQKPGEHFRFQTMHFGLAPQLVDTQVTLLGLDELQLADGSLKKVRKFELQNPQNPDSKTYEWRDETGKLYKAQMPQNGLELVYASPQELKLSPAPATEALTKGIAVLPSILDPAHAERAVYDIYLKQSNNLKSLAIPESETQTVQTLADRIRVTVSKQRPITNNALLPLSVGLNLQEYLKNSLYIERDAAEVQQAATSIIGNERRASVAIQKLRDWVHENIVNKNYETGFASAKTTLLNRSGDCTEHAVLLAALARAAGIPSRVAAGLLYNAKPGGGGRFVYHMWTEVWLGQGGAGAWIPLDATQKSDLVGATHIKLMDSALNESADLVTLTEKLARWMGQIRIDILQTLSPGNSILSLTGNPQTIKLDLSSQTEQTSPFFRIDQVKPQKQLLSVGPLPESLHPDAPEALFTKGLEQLAAQETSSAIQSFEKAIQNTQHPLALALLGKKLEAAELWPLAKHAFEQASRQAPSLSSWVQKQQRHWPDLPSNLWPSYWQAIGLELSGSSSAMDAFRRIIQEAPGFTPAYLHLGRLSSGNEAITWLQKGLMRSPQNAQLLEALGDAWMEQRLFPKALEAYAQAEKAYKLSPSNQDTNLIPRIHGKQKQAQGACLLKTAPKSADGWSLSGQGLALLGHVGEARKAFENALQSQPEHPNALIGLFSLALDTADWDLMTHRITALEKLTGTRAEAARLAGRYRMRQRRYPEAIALLEKAHALAPGNTTITLDLVEAYSRMPLYLQNIGQQNNLAFWQTKCERVLQTGIGKATAPLPLRLRLGELMLERGKFPEAKQLAEDIIATEPLNASAYWIKGYAALARNDFNEAKIVLESARTLEPFNADILATLGHLAMESGDEARAIQLYRDALRLEPAHEVAIVSLRNSNARGIKSSLKMPLNADERDYLIQAFLLCRQEGYLALQFLEELHRLLDHYGSPEFSIHFIELLKEFIPMAQQAAQRQSQLYETASQMRPPIRFLDFHRLLSHNLRLSSEQYEFWINTAGFFTSKERDEILKQRQEQLNYSTQISKQLTEAREEIFAQLPQSDFQQITYEAHVPELTEVLPRVMELGASAQQKLLPTGKTPRGFPKP